MRRREQLRTLRDRLISPHAGHQPTRPARHPVIAFAVRLAVAVVGIGVVLIGAVLIPLPGPGWLIVLAGLGILALEFVWARWLLRFTRARLDAWWHWVGRQPLPTRILIGIAGLIFVAGVAWLSLRTTLGAPLWPQ